MTKITKEDLTKAGMPPWDVRKFAIEWPDGAEISGQNIERAKQIGLTPPVLLYAVLDDATIKEWRDEHIWSDSATPSGKKIEELQAEISILKAKVEGERKAINNELDAKYLRIAFGGE